MTQSEGELSQASYSGTPYEDASWEMVGDAAPTLEFVPLQVEVISSERVTVDPMFEDFGGISKTADAKRWHLPENVRHNEAEESEGPEQKGQREAMVKLAELEAAKQKALAEGIKKGQEDAKLEHQEQLAQLKQGVENVLSEMAQQTIQHQDNIAKRAVELALSISKKILDQAVEINPEYIQNVIREALQLAGGAQVKKVRVSPQDLEFIEVVGLSKEIRGDDAIWNFESDPEISSGCVVETIAGEIDYQLDQAWERIKEEVVKVARNG